MGWAVSPCPAPPRSPRPARPEPAVPLGASPPPLCLPAVPRDRADNPRQDKTEQPSQNGCVGRDLEGHLFPTLCCRQGCGPLQQARDLGRIQPGLGCQQGWGTPSLSDRALRLLGSSCPGPAAPLPSLPHRGSQPRSLCTAPRHPYTRAAVPLILSPQRPDCFPRPSSPSFLIAPPEKLAVHFYQSR